MIVPLFIQFDDFISSIFGSRISTSYPSCSTCHYRPPSITPNKRDQNERYARTLFSNDIQRGTKNEEAPQSNDLRARKITLPRPSPEHQRRPDCHYRHHHQPHNFEAISNHLRSPDSPSFLNPHPNLSPVDHTTPFPSPLSTQLGQIRTRCHAVARLPRTL